MRRVTHASSRKRMGSLSSVWSTLPVREHPGNGDPSPDLEAMSPNATGMKGCLTRHYLEEPKADALSQTIWVRIQTKSQKLSLIMSDTYLKLGVVLFPIHRRQGREQPAGGGAVVDFNQPTLANQRSASPWATAAATPTQRSANIWPHLDRVRPIQKSGQICKDLAGSVSAFANLDGVGQI